MNNKEKGLTKEEFNHNLKVLEDFIRLEIEELEEIEKRKYKNDKFLSIFLGTILFIIALFKLITFLS